MKKCIDRLSQKRAHTKDATTKDVLKKAMNSLYGKMLQDKKGYRNVTAYTDSSGFERAASRRGADFSVLTFDADSNLFFGLVDTPKRGGAVLDTPRAVGFAILEETKAMMWDVHYQFYKRRYGNRAKLCMTDTDSFIYHIKLSLIHI